MLPGVAHYYTSMRKYFILRTLSPSKGQYQSILMIMSPTFGHSYTKKTVYDLIMLKLKPTSSKITKSLPMKHLDS